VGGKVGAGRPCLGGESRSNEARGRATLQAFRMFSSEYNLSGEAIRFLEHHCSDIIKIVIISSRAITYSINGRGSKNQDLGTSG